MTTHRPFRFGVVPNEPTSREAWIRTARKAEDAGYSTILLTDHLDQNPAPLIAAMSALDATQSLHVGTQVLATPLRNPAMLAKEVASLDFLSGGRFELGLGAGWPPDSPTGRSDAAQTGIDMGPPGERIERLAEAVSIIRSVLREREPFDFVGAHTTLRGVAPYPRVENEGLPRLMIAGAGPRIMRLAARQADIVNIAPRPPTVGPTRSGSLGFGLTTSEVVALIKQEAGPRYDEIELCVNSMGRAAGNPSVTTNGAEARLTLARALGLPPDVVAAMPATLIGTVPELVERLQRDRDELDISYRVIPEDAMDEFTPIVAKLSGS